MKVSNRNKKFNNNILNKLKELEKAHIMAIKSHKIMLKQIQQDIKKLNYIKEEF